MNTHCNVQCSRLQFAKQLLEGSSISTPLDPGYEGGTIAAEVLDSSDSLRELCAKCGRNLTCGGLATYYLYGHLPTTQDIPFKVCPQVSAYRSRLKCLVCRPADREDFCFCCNSPATQDIILCGANSINGCQNFVHRLCLAK